MVESEFCLSLCFLFLVTCSPFIFTDAFGSAKMLCDQYYLCAPDVILQEMNRKLQNLGILEVCPAAHIDPLALNLPRCEKSFKVIMQTASRVKVIAVQ